MIILMLKGVRINNEGSLVVEREMECDSQSCGHNYLCCTMRLFGLSVDSKDYRNTSGSSCRTAGVDLNGCLIPLMQVDLACHLHWQTRSRVKRSEQMMTLLFIWYHVSDISIWYSNPTSSHTLALSVSRSNQYGG
jgi:hypothetical protein